MLGQLAKLAERERLANLLVGHLNKAPTSDVYLRVGGSGAFFNASRLVVTVTPDPADPDWQRLVVGHKANSAHPDPERWRVVGEGGRLGDGAGRRDDAGVRRGRRRIRREDVLAPSATGEKRSGGGGAGRSRLAQGRRRLCRREGVGDQPGSPRRR